MNASTSQGSVDELLEDQAASQWMKTALRAALERDPVDALNDALVLAAILEKRLRSALELTEFEDGGADTSSPPLTGVSSNA